MKRLHVVAADVSRSGSPSPLRAYFREREIDTPKDEPGEVYLQLGDMASVTASVRLSPSQIEFLAIEFIKWLDQPEVISYMRSERVQARERVRLWLLEQEAKKQLREAAK